MGLGACVTRAAEIARIVLRGIRAALPSRKTGREAMRILPLALVVVIVTAGCATIMEGTSQSVQITTMPPGARCFVDRGRPVRVRSAARPAAFGSTRVKTISP